jgi:hypothetical protein
MRLLSFTISLAEKSADGPVVLFTFLWPYFIFSSNMFLIRSTLSRHVRNLTTTVRHKSTIIDVESVQLDQIPIERIRNFSMVAHVDHGEWSYLQYILYYLGNRFTPFTQVFYAVI